MKKIVLKPIPSSPQPLKPEFEQALNPNQREAVYFNEGPLLVIAGAGSGKTKTLTYRVARLIHDGVAPEQILLLTFTRKSAKEMLNRAAEVLDQRCRDVAGGTFHSFANLCLREYAAAIGFEPTFTILDRSDAEDMVGNIRKQLGYHQLQKRFPKKKIILNIISKAINTERSIRDILREDAPQFIDFAEEIETINTQYPAKKKTMQVMDYDDLLTYFLKLLSIPSVQTAFNEHYRYVLVDEYQDTNAIQSAIIKKLASGHHNIMVVGDDSQSIYSFRGANFKNIMDFPTLFPNTTIITLEQNYRSHQNILNLTNAVIDNAIEKYTKHLFSDRSSDQKPIYVETDSENMQSRFVCQTILERREAGESLKDMAVLIRSSWHSNDLEVTLKTHNIPFQKVGGFKFVESAHVKDLISFARIIANPNDQLSWSRILLLLEGVGPLSAQKVITDIMASLTAQAPIPLTSYKDKKYYNELKKIVHFVFQPHPTNQVGSTLSKALDFYTPLFKKKYDDYNKRQADLDSMCQIAERYTVMDAFLSEMSLDPPNGSQIDTEASDLETEKLTLSTIHSAKGLEWKSVFLLSAIDGFLPAFQSIGDPEQVEEERRLLYVALTRAKDRLYIIKPQLDSGKQYPYGGFQFSKVSRFLSQSNILKKHTETWTLVEENRPQKLPEISFDDDTLPPANPNRRQYSF